VQLVRDPLNWQWSASWPTSPYATNLTVSSCWLTWRFPAGHDPGRLILWIGLKIGVAILVIGLIDYLYQRWEVEKSLKMSLQEVRDETKETEGNPEVKARARQIQRHQARQRMITAVPKADVVVTNPTHIAVALKYDRPNGCSTVLAKGQRLIAEQIKRIAREHGIPVIEDKPLARALYKMCEVGDLVRQLYRAVAEVWPTLSPQGKGPQVGRYGTRTRFHPVSGQALRYRACRRRDRHHHGLIIPLPPRLLDFALAFNITFSLGGAAARPVHHAAARPSVFPAVVDHHVTAAVAERSVNR